MKSDSRLSRNFLKGVQGDAINALLCAVAHNLRKILNKLRLFCAYWLVRACAWLGVGKALAATLEFGGVDGDGGQLLVHRRGLGIGAF
jgi:hypothetical protein